MVVTQIWVFLCSHFSHPPALPLLAIMMNSIFLERELLGGTKLPNSSPVGTCLARSPFSIGGQFKFLISSSASFAFQIITHTYFPRILHPAGSLFLVWNLESQLNVSKSVKSPLGSSPMSRERGLSCLSLQASPPSSS